MRPLKLMMQAFGPYAGKEEIDFRELGNRTMFVISGKTGAGKTTIFDGISFAIYGKASGEDRNGSDLRSQFAEEELQTEVSLEFSLRNKTYYIWRSPQQDKKKARGEGFTTIGAKAELYVINGDGSRNIIASNVREADEKIKEIVQLDANQFRQILMIPQGEFRKLLTSDSKDKEVILQRLFHTELYKKIEDRLKEEASLLKKVVETKVNERSQHLKSILYTENEELKELLSEDNPNDLKVLPLLDEQLKMWDGKLKIINEQIQHTIVKRDEAKRMMDEASILNKEFEDRELLVKRKEVLEYQREEMTSKQKEIEDAYKAFRLEQQDLLCHRLRKEYDEYIQQLKEIETQIEIVTLKLAEAEKQYLLQEAKKEERERIAEEITNLLNLKEDIQSIAERTQQLNNLEVRKATLEKNIDITKLKMVKLEENIVENKQNIKNIERIRLQLFESEKENFQLTDNINKLNKIHSLLQDEELIRKKNDESKRQYDRFNHRLSDLKSTVAVLEENWQKGQASLIAAKLVNNSPCPVCGSIHHPSPAESGDQIPTENELKSARNDVEKLESEKLAAESAWVEIKSRYSAVKMAVVEKMQEVLNCIPDFSVENLLPITNQYIDRQKSLEKLLLEQKSNIALLPKLEKELEELEFQQQDEKTKLEEFKIQEREVTLELIEKKTALEQIVKKIPAEIRSKDQYEAKLTKANNMKKQLNDALENARNEWQKKKEQLSGLNASFHQQNELVKNSEVKLQAERDTFKLMLDENGFDGYQHFSKSKRTQEQIKHLEATLQNYREEYRSISDRLNDMNARLENVVKPDMEILKLQFLQFEGQLTALTNDFTNIKMNINHNETIKTRVMNINQEIKKAEEQFHLIGHLSDVAKGQNTYRITFERFVLASFLDDILLVANTRLIKMTSGRYSLLRKKDRSKGNVQSGLELLIFDQYTGQVRHVKTLSGGESFKAALALALGLAEVVQQYAGGVSLETMFIDEGFGTLDPESLDHAIEALMDIQNSGRLVGIISHVPELKERIDARLEVISSQNGSHTEFHFMG